MISKIRPWNPLLVVESKEDFDWLSHDLGEGLGWDLLSTPEPSQWWYDAFQASSLSVPIGSDLPFATAAGELDPLDGRVIDALTKDIDGSSTL
jgi:hypothetical protein